MNYYYCINLKFKDNQISSKIFHSHLYISDKEMYFKIIDNEVNSTLDRDFAMSKNSIGLFEDNIEIIETAVSLLFNHSVIYKLTSFQNDLKNNYFNIYVTKIALIIPNKSKEIINQGSAFLNSNGLKVANSFYSFFSNHLDKNQFLISRMNGMKDFYNADQLSFRPELEFTNNEERGSEEFTVKKVPIIKYHFTASTFEQAKKILEIICSFLSFCFGVRIILNKIIYTTEDDIFIYRDTSPNNKKFVSDFSTIFRHLEENYNIEKILSTAWFSSYILKEKQLEKAIDNYLHSREVDYAASFLLLFNVIEIFNGKQEIEKFEFTDDKETRFLQAFELISKSLINKEEIILLKDKWNGLISKIEIKPLKSPLEQTLKYNNINPLDFGYSLGKLKKTRDRLTHGSVGSIDENDLKFQVFCLRNISARLILANLGLKQDLKHLNKTSTHY